MRKVRWVMSCAFCSKYFIRFPAVQKFWKSVKIWRSYREFKGENFFLRHSVVIHTPAVRSSYCLPAFVHVSRCPSTQKCRDVHKTLSHKTETLNPEDRDETRRSKKHLETASRPRLRCSKKRIKTAVSQFKNTNWWSLSLDNLFLAGQIHYFLRDIFALHACSQD